jgi:hypothetical protein
MAGRRFAGLPNQTTVQVRKTLSGSCFGAHRSCLKMACPDGSIRSLDVGRQVPADLRDNQA